MIQNKQVKIDEFVAFYPSGKILEMKLDGLVSLETIEGKTESFSSFDRLMLNEEGLVIRKLEWWEVL